MTSRLLQRMIAGPFKSNEEKEELFSNLSSAALRNLMTGCDDPGGGGCMGVYCDSCTARNVLRKRKASPR